MLGAWLGDGVPVESKMARRLAGGDADGRGAAILQSGRCKQMLLVSYGVTQSQREQKQQRCGGVFAFLWCPFFGLGVDSNVCHHGSSLADREDT